LKTANWGFVVYDTQKKQVITEYNSDTPLIPASTTKLLSDSFNGASGGKFRWITQLEYSGEISPEGTLNGDYSLLAVAILPLDLVKLALFYGEYLQIT
jgi:D-alanyl-D-alanine carboxypeptidase/D-alanyl-D-alanine-endopeptidase (penicillin-binding protein 4)